MADVRRRLHLGGAASAALPILWAVLAERGWSHARLAAELEGEVAKLLYGDRKPGRTASLKLRDIGVPIELWDQPLPEGWTIPHAGADESGEHPSVATSRSDTG